MVSHWSLLLVDAVGKIAHSFGHQFNVFNDNLFGLGSTGRMEANVHVLHGIVGDRFDVREFGHTVVVTFKYGGEYLFQIIIFILNY